MSSQLVVVQKFSGYGCGDFPAAAIEVDQQSCRHNPKYSLSRRLRRVCRTQTMPERYALVLSLCCQEDHAPEASARQVTGHLRGERCAARWLADEISVHRRCDRIA